MDTFLATPRADRQCHQQYIEASHKYPVEKVKEVKDTVNHGTTLAVLKKFIKLVKLGNYLLGCALLRILFIHDCAIANTETYQESEKCTVNHQTTLIFLYNQYTCCGRPLLKVHCHGFSKNSILSWLSEKVFNAHYSHTIVLTYKTSVIVNLSIAYAETSVTVLL